VENIEEWILKFNREKVQKVKYSLKQDLFNKTDSYKKPFKKLMDYYDPHNSQYMLTEHLFKDLYALREIYA
jgi:hypothetical protein